MILTLYSNCRLTKSYNEVIHHNFLDAYLNAFEEGVTKYTYEVDDIYLTRTGRFNVAMMNASQYKCNYMKLEDTINNIKRYYFIDDIEIVNGLCVIDYTEDIFSSYSRDINISKGDISNLRYGIGSNPKFLPNEYISNNKLNITSFNTSNEYTKKVYIILEVSYYKMQSSGVTTDRNTLVGVISEDGTANNPLEQLMFLAFGDCEYLNVQSSTPNSFHVGSEDYNYDIINAYIIPKEYYDLLNIGSLSSTITIGTGDVYYLNTITIGEKKYNFSFNNDYKRYAIGTFDTYVPVDNNGTNIDCELIATNDLYRFRLILKVGTNILDITHSFNYEMTISVQSADVTQQQAISRELKNNRLDLDRDNMIAKAITGGVGAIAKTGLSAYTGDIGGTIDGALGGLDIVRETYIGLKKNDLDKWYTNYKAYTTNTAVNTKRNVLLNVLYGIIDFTISPDNETYINNLIDVIGYKTLIIVNNTDLINNAQESQSYNIIKFNNVWIYGNFSYSIQTILEDILKKGIKIWFTSNV